MGSMMQLELQLPLSLLQLGEVLDIGDSLKMQSAVNNKDINSSLELTKIKNSINILISGAVTKLLEEKAGKWQCMIHSVKDPQNVDPESKESPQTDSVTLLVKKECESDLLDGSLSKVDETLDSSASLFASPSDKEDGKVECIYCKRVYKREGSLLNHLAKCHKGEKSTIPMKKVNTFVKKMDTPAQFRVENRQKPSKKYSSPVKCSMCGLPYSSEKHLLKHMANLHGVNSDITVNLNRVTKDSKAEATRVEKPSTAEEPDQEKPEKRVAIPDEELALIADQIHEDGSADNGDEVSKKADNSGTLAINDDEKGNDSDNVEDHENDIAVDSDSSSMISSDDPGESESDEWDIADEYSKGKKRKKSLTELKTSPKAKLKPNPLQADDVDDKGQKEIHESAPKVKELQTQESTPSEKNQGKEHFECPRCDMTTASYLSFRRHVLKFHKDVSNKEFKMYIEDRKVYKTEGETLNKCHYCPRERPGRAIQRHMLIWHDDEPDFKERLKELRKALNLTGDHPGSEKRYRQYYSLVTKGFCCHCKQTFAGPKELKHHKKFECTKNRRQKTAELECFDCGYKANDREDLITHKKEHLKEKPTEKKFICHLCGQSFLYQGGLYMHMQVKHDSCKPGKITSWTCETCGRTFKYKGIYKRHLLTHDNQMHATCEICGRPYKTKRDLDVHRQRIHFGIYPHHCQLCGHGVQKKESLLTHRCGNVQPKMPRDRSKGKIKVDKQQQQMDSTPRESTITSQTLSQSQVHYQGEGYVGPSSMYHQAYGPLSPDGPSYGPHRGDSNQPWNATVWGGQM